MAGQSFCIAKFALTRFAGRNSLLQSRRSRGKVGIVGRRPMRGLITRFFQRLFVLALGIISIWLIVFVVFRVSDNRLPWILALAVTYGIGAYVILPRAVRTGLKILQRKRVPRYT